MLTTLIDQMRITNEGRSVKTTTTATTKKKKKTKRNNTISKQVTFRIKEFK